MGFRMRIYVTRGARNYLLFFLGLYGAGALVMLLVTIF